MKYKVFLTHKAKKDLINLDRKTQTRIVDKLRFFIASGESLQYAKKLKDYRFGNYRFRVGDCRIVFDVDKNGDIQILMILRIMHRKKI